MKLLAAPLTDDQARELMSGAVADLAGFSDTPAVLAEFDVAPGDESEHLVLLIARAAGLLAGARFVVTAEAQSRDSEPAEFGAVLAWSVALGDVRGVFVDADPGAARAAADTVAGGDLGEAWESPMVQQFLETSDLLWHHPRELGALLGAPEAEAGPRVP